MGAVTKRKRSAPQQAVLYATGGMGYLTAMSGWLAVFAVALPRLLDSAAGKWVFPERGELPSEVVAPAGRTLEPSLLLTFLTTVLALSLIVAIIYVVVMKYIPKATKTVSEAVHVTAQTAAPVFARRPVAKLSPQRRKRLTERVVLYIKIVLAVLPTFFFGMVYVQERTLMREVGLMVAGSLSALSVFAFGLQAVLAKRWKAATRDVL